jgi:glycosyltransferase involved in cell wall biosynthesis
MIENRHNFIDSLNKGMQATRGKYIARMDADDIMHVDRLKVPFSIMEEEPDITVCGSQMIFFGENLKPTLSKQMPGLIESPLITFLYGNSVPNSTVLIRRDFLQNHKLKYEIYPYAEDYKLWTEIAKRGGMFYLESQPLIYYRIHDTQITQQKRQEQLETTYLIKEEIIDYLILQSTIGQSTIIDLKNKLKELKELHLVNSDEISHIFHSIFTKNKTLIRA